MENIIILSLIYLFSSNIILASGWERLPDEPSVIIEIPACMNHVESFEQLTKLEKLDADITEEIARMSGGRNYIKLLKISGCCGMIGLPGSLLTIAGTLMSRMPDCFRFICDDNYTAIGTQCRDALGNIFNATRELDRQCHDDYYTSIIIPLGLGLSLAIPCCMLAMRKLSNDTWLANLHRPRHWPQMQNLDFVRTHKTHEKKRYTKLMLDYLLLDKLIDCTQIIFEYTTPGDEAIFARGAHL